MCGRELCKAFPNCGAAEVVAFRAVDIMGENPPREGSPIMGSRQRTHRTNRSYTTVGSGSGVVPASNVVVNDAPGIATQSDSVNATATVVPDGVPAAQKIKGAAQMAGGAALVAAGVPMCILPGPGVAAIAGGAALASKGQRNFSGREATPVEAKLGEAAKDQAAQAARTAVKKAPEVAGKAACTVAHQAPKVADAVAKTVPKVADSVARTAPKVADAVARTVPQVASKVAQTAPAAAVRAAEVAPKVASAISERFRR